MKNLKWKMFFVFLSQSLSLNLPAWDRGRTQLVVPGSVTTHLTVVVSLAV